MPLKFTLSKPFFVWQNRKLIKLHPEEVVSLRIDENYTKIFIDGGKTYTIRSTMTTVLRNLPEDIFVRVHKKYAVSILFISSIANDHVVIETQTIPIGRQYRNALFEKLNIIE